MLYGFAFHALNSPEHGVDKDKDAVDQTLARYPDTEEKLIVVQEHIHVQAYRKLFAHALEDCPRCRNCFLFYKHITSIVIPR